MNDRTTGEYLVARLGSAVRTERVGNTLQRIVSQLREVNEAERECRANLDARWSFARGQSPSAETFRGSGSRRAGASMARSGTAAPNYLPRCPPRPVDR
jgi:hypothetical protein